MRRDRRGRETTTCGNRQRGRQGRRSSRCQESSPACQERHCSGKSFSEAFLPSRAAAAFGFDRSIIKYNAIIVQRTVSRHNTAGSARQKSEPNGADPHRRAGRGWSPATTPAPALQQRQRPPVVILSGHLVETEACCRCSSLSLSIPPLHCDAKPKTCSLSVT